MSGLRLVWTRVCASMCLWACGHALMQPQCGNSSRLCTLGIQTVGPLHAVALGQTVLKDLVVLIHQYFHLNVLYVYKCYSELLWREHLTPKYLPSTRNWCKKQQYFYILSPPESADLIDLVQISTEAIQTVYCSAEIKKGKCWVMAPALILLNIRDIFPFVTTSYKSAGTQTSSVVWPKRAKLQNPNFWLFVSPDGPVPSDMHVKYNVITAAMLSHCATHTILAAAGLCVKFSNATLNPCTSSFSCNGPTENSYLTLNCGGWLLVVALTRHSVCSARKW